MRQWRSAQRIDMQRGGHRDPLRHLFMNACLSRRPAEVDSPRAGPRSREFTRDGYDPDNAFHHNRNIRPG
jgi:hypothetical protein